MSERSDLLELRRRLIDGKFYEDYDEDVRLVGVFRKFLAACIGETAEDDRPEPRYGLFCEHLPDNEGVRKITFGHQTYDTLDEAQKACDQVRYQNLPFRAWPIAVADPRNG